MSTAESKTSFTDIISTTNLANIGAFIAFTGGFAYAFYTKDTNMMNSLVLVAIGYLFGQAKPK